MSEDVPAGPENKSVLPGPLGGLLGVTRNLAIASLGVVSVIADDASTIYKRSLERGQDNFHRVEEKLEELGRSLPRPPRPPRRRRRKSPYDSEEWRAALAKLNVASPEDVEVLAQQVAALEAKIDLLSSKPPAE